MIARKTSYDNTKRFLCELAEFVTAYGWQKGVVGRLATKHHVSKPSKLLVADIANAEITDEVVAAYIAARNSRCKMEFPKKRRYAGRKPRTKKDNPETPETHLAPKHAETPEKPFPFVQPEMKFLPHTDEMCYRMMSDLQVIKNQLNILIHILNEKL